MSSTDHVSFDDAGVPGFQFIGDSIKYETKNHHSNMDVYGHLQVYDLMEAATIVAVFVYDAAMKDAKLREKNCR